MFYQPGDFPGFRKVHIEGDIYVILRKKILRKTKRKNAKLSLSDNPIFSPKQTKQAIPNSKLSPALGQDGLCKVHLKHLGNFAPDYLTYLFNLFMFDKIIPCMWKKIRRHAPAQT